MHTVCYSVPITNHVHIAIPSNSRYGVASLRKSVHTIARSLEYNDCVQFLYEDEALKLCRVEDHVKLHNARLRIDRIRMQNQSESKQNNPHVRVASCQKQYNNLSKYTSKHFKLISGCYCNFM